MCLLAVLFPKIKIPIALEFVCLWRVVYVCVFNKIGVVVSRGFGRK